MTPSLYNIRIVYDVRGVPPLYGTDQLIRTFKPLIAVLIELGTSGYRAAITIS